MYIRMFIFVMSKIYSVADARTHPPEILDQVEEGKDVRLSRRGKLVAVVSLNERYVALRGEHPRFSDTYARFVQRPARESRDRSGGLNAK